MIKNIKFYSKLYNFKIFQNQIVKKIIKSNNSKNIYIFTLHVNKLKEEHITLFVDKLIQISKGRTLLYFAKNVKLNQLDIDKISNAITKINDPYIIYNYYSCIKKIDDELVFKMMKKIINSNDPEYIYLFTKKYNTKNNNIENLVDALIKIGNIYYMNLFLNDIENLEKAEIQKLLNEIIKNSSISFSYKLILKYRQYLTNDNFMYIVEKLIKTKDYENMYLYAKDINLPNNILDLITDEIIKYGSSKIICFYLKDVKNLSSDKINLLVKKLCETCNIRFIELIIKEKQLNEENISLLFNTVLKIHDNNSFKILCEINNKYKDIVFLEKDILKSKQINIILDYIYLTKNINLIKALFKNIKYFYDLCLVTKDIHFNTNNLHDWLVEKDNIDIYKDFDEKINNYIKTFDK